ncbi:hypothetical protein C1646_764130 [Rhizophagus diaphanus]|nr:hypothetical protein C1646_764130 [Rhizophagus diaphanus] [Rhizophagus sp. MUCL 43196]
MDLDSSEDYRGILERLCPLTKRHDHETPEMWCSHIRDLFRKILEENYSSENRILSKNKYITMYGKLYVDDKIHNHLTNYIYCKEAKINRLQLELLSQSTLHSEKDKLASISYDIDGNFTASYKNYAQSKAKDTMPNALNFKPTYILPIRQETILPTSYQSSSPSQRRLKQGITSEIFISS